MFGQSIGLSFRNLPYAGPHAFASILGLAVAVSVVMLIALFINDELSYDEWINGGDRIYQVSAVTPDGAMTDSVPSDVAGWLTTEFPQLEAVTRLYPSEAILRRADEEFSEPIVWADANVFAVFDLPVIAGNLLNALNKPDTLVLTRRLANKYFGRTDATGETLLLNNEHLMEVSAVIEDLPSNTHLDFDVLAAAHSVHSPAAEQDRIPMSIFGGKRWNSRTYIVLKKGDAIDPLRQPIETLTDRHSVTSTGQKPSEVWPIVVRPIRALHLSSRMVGAPDRENHGRLYGAAGIAVLVLVVASVNFITLRTALALRRAREVGVRKVLGASRGTLFGQFMSEVLVHVLLATVLGTAFAVAALPALNAFLVREIQASRLLEPLFVAGSAAFVAITTVMAGAYPAFVLSSFRPAVITRGMSVRLPQRGLRTTLVTVQFGAVIAVTIASIVVHRQMAFGLTEALRAVDEPIVVLHTTCADSFREAMARVSGVKGAACAQALPQTGMTTMGPVQYKDRERYVIRTLSVGIGFFELYNVKPIAGRLFSDEFGTDVTPADRIFRSPEAIVINQTAASRFGFGSDQQAVGEVVRINRGTVGGFTGEHDARVVGVVQDFQIGSVLSEIYPAVFYVDPGRFTLLSLKLDGAMLVDALAGIDQVWKEMGGLGPTPRTFFEDSVEEMYVDLHRDRTLFSVFSAVSLVIALLGLVALAAYATAERTKEVGIRKVLGGDRAAIMTLLVWRFSRPVLLANLFAWPIAYVLMGRWLDGFARRIDLDLWTFVVAGAATVVVAWITVLFQTWKIANTHPAVAVRHQ
jgi:putative ABC transport system permease protein